MVTDFFKNTFNLRTQKWLNALHGFSILFIACPLTLISFSLFTEQGETKIEGYPFEEEAKFIMLTLLSVIVAFNLASLIFNSAHRFSLGLSGVFFVVVGLIHLVRLFHCSEYILLGSGFDLRISYITAGLLPAFGLLNIAAGVQVHFKGTDREKTHSLFELFHRFRWALLQESTYTVTILGLVAAFFVAIPVTTIGIAIAYTLLEDLFIEENMVKQLIWIGWVGAQGSLISIFMRIRRLSENNNNKYHLFINALFRPFVGLSLAHLSFFMIKTGLINAQQFGKEKEFYFAVIVAFVSGFTERIGTSIRTEKS